jgi:hypothetical protein
MALATLRRALPVVVLLAGSICSAGLNARTQSDQIVTLHVDGRSNQAPWVAASGNTVAVAWGASLDGRSDVFVAMSRDGGRRFDPPKQVNDVPGEARLGGELPPRVDLRQTSSGALEVIVVWTARAAATEIKLARSADGGRTFSAPITLQAAGAAGDRGWPALTVDASGTAHVVWLDHRGMAAGADEHAHHKSGEYDGVAMAQRSGLYYRASGETNLPERQLTPGVCYCCKTALVASPSGALYAAWRHVYPGNIRDIAFTASRGGGHSFAPPIRVSEDRWQLNGCPDDGPAMVVDTTGRVHVIWPTVLQGDEPEGALFYATSDDGRRFTPRVRVPTMGSPKPSHPQISADSNGRVMVAWDEVIDGTRSAFVRELAPDASKLQATEPIRLDPHNSSMYPVMAAVADATVVAWTSGTAGTSVIRLRRVAASADTRF